MSPVPPACAAHRALVEEACGPAPSDDALERYAVEVPTCPECRKRLAVRVGAHPSRFDAPPAGRWDGMARLAAALRARPARDRSRWGWVAAAAAVAAVALWAGSGGAAPTPASPRVVTVAPARASERVVPAPVPIRVEPRRAPEPVSAPVVRPKVAPVAPIDPIEPADAVAEADDWPPPPFEDLRGGASKGGDSRVRSIELVVSGRHHVGGAVDLTIVSSTPSPIAVCVTGPERGMVWRGEVPAGRVELTRGGRPVRFAFAAPGRYEWVVATDPGSCARPVHRVEVEVVP